MAKDTLFYKKKTISVSGNLLKMDSPLVMGIINLTKDSFYSNSRVQSLDKLLEKVRQMLDEGADLLDVGAYSTRPGANDVSETEERKQIIAAVKTIKSNYPKTIISIDSFRSGVAAAGIEAGADIINDISGGQLDQAMFATVAELQVPYILMHSRGTPQNMQSLTDYDDVIKEVYYYFSEKISALTDLGVNDIILDPGFGFAKTLDQNYEILKNLQYFNTLERPLLVGVSRKSMIQKVLDLNSADALNGTTVLHTFALLHGANILRVHDIKAAKEAVKLTNKLIA